MPKKDAPPLQGELLQGTLDLLILQTLVLGAAHGHTIAHAIERRSEDVLQVEHGSLYPALHRLEGRGWIASFWGTSENNRKARYYRLTRAGRKEYRSKPAAGTNWCAPLIACCGRLRSRPMGLTRFFRRRAWDNERARELETYLQMETDENIARGMLAEEARYAARRKLGNPTFIREEIY